MKTAVVLFSLAACTYSSSPPVNDISEDCFDKLKEGDPSGMKRIGLHARLSNMIAAANKGDAASTALPVISMKNLKTGKYVSYDDADKLILTRCIDFWSEKVQHSTNGLEEKLEQVLDNMIDELEKSMSEEVVPAKRHAKKSAKVLSFYHKKFRILAKNDPSWRKRKALFKILVDMAKEVEKGGDEQIKIEIPKVLTDHDYQNNKEIEIEMSKEDQNLYYEIITKWSHAIDAPKADTKALRRLIVDAWSTSGN